MSEYSRSPRQPRKRQSGSAPKGATGARSTSKSGSRSESKSSKSGSKRGAGARFAGSTKPSQPTKLPSRPASPPVDVHDPEGVRLQKLMAAAGVGSRRVCENLIEQGRVEVDGHVVTELGVRINPRTQVVHVDGVRVNLARYTRISGSSAATVSPTATWTSITGTSAKSPISGTATSSLS